MGLEDEQRNWEQGINDPARQPALPQPGYGGFGAGHAGRSYGETIYAPPASTGYVYGGPAPERAAMHELRPLTTGEILDRTFTLYRSRFWLFAGIASVAGVVQVVGSGLQLTGMSRLMRASVASAIPGHSGTAFTPAQLRHSGETIFLSYAVTLIYLLVAAVVAAGAAWAVSEVYLGRGATIGQALRVARTRWITFIAVSIWQIFSFLWLPMLLSIATIIAAAFLATRLRGAGAYWVIPTILFFSVFGGFVFGAIRYLMNSLAIPASVIEGLKTRTSIRRSKTLARGTKGRIFLVLLVVWTMYLVAGIIQSPLSFLMLMAPGKSHVLAEAAMLVVAFLAHTVVGPVMMIGLTLVYFDQRVRNEAFDLVMLMSEADSATGATAMAGGSPAPRMGDAPVG